MKLYRVVVAVLVLLLSGCGVIQDYRQSQMFSSFDDFRAGPEGGIDLIWSKPGIESIKDFNEILQQYDSVILDRVWLVLSDKTRYDNLSEQEIVEVSDYLLEKIKQKASARFEIVETPREKTLRISIALTNIETPNPILAVTSSIFPIGLGISTIAKVVTGEHTNVGSATIEMMLSDANSGDPIVAVIDRKAGSKDFSTMIDSTDDARDAIDWWVERIALTLKGERIE